VLAGTLVVFAVSRSIRAKRERFWNGPTRLPRLLARSSPTLIASHPGNQNAVRHGVHSRVERMLAPRAFDTRGKHAAKQKPAVSGGF
jgi:hypothetical protein